MFRKDRWQGFSADQAEEAARLAEVSGWQVASHNYMKSMNPWAYRMAVDENRTQLRFLLPLTAESRVLNLGCSWGALALNLATCTEYVVGMDSRAPNLRFALTRGHQMEVSGLQMMQGSLCAPLPFADRSFDAVVILETSEGSEMPKEPGLRQAPSQLLGEIRRVLGPGASVLWGVSNRLGLGHPPVAFKQQLRTYWGYVRALRNAGFEMIEFFAALPSHLEPYFIVPFNKSKLIEFLIDDLLASGNYRSKISARGLGLTYAMGCAAWRLGRRFGLSRLVPYFSPSYLIVAG